MSYFVGLPGIMKKQIDSFPFKIGRRMVSGWCKDIESVSQGDAASLSRTHVCIEQDRGILLMEDTSAAGTFRTHPVEEHARRLVHVLNDGDRYELNRVEVEFRISPVELEALDVDTPKRIVHVGSGRSVPLNADSTTSIGRHDRCDLRIEDASLDVQHVLVERDRGFTVLVGVGVTRRHGQPLDQAQRLYIVKSGDEFQLEESRILFE